MKIQRHFTQPHSNAPFDTVAWERRTALIKDEATGKVVFQMEGVEVPANWSEHATNIMASKYFRKAGVPQRAEDLPYLVKETQDQPVTFVNGTIHVDGKQLLGPERSVKQIVHRLAGCWRAWGDDAGFFDGTDDQVEEERADRIANGEDTRGIGEYLRRMNGETFYNEVVYALLHQMMAPNSPQWFNTGLYWAYGIKGAEPGNWFVEPGESGPQRADNSYIRPMPHACFILNVEDSLTGPGSIMDLLSREALLFKYGAGTGTNFSKLRAKGEPLNNGGVSGGLMSWLKIFDTSAGAIKSGGTTRKAAKMVCLDQDHPELFEFIGWKAREELKVRGMVESDMMHRDIARHDVLPPGEVDAYEDSAAKVGLPPLSYDFNGEAYQTVSGQNSNNSVRFTDQFFEALKIQDGAIVLRARTRPEMGMPVHAQRIWGAFCHAAWRCADPGAQYDTTINAWHTCPKGGRIRASNPCSEYMFLDNTACNLASMNVASFYQPNGQAYDLDAFVHVVDLLTMILEISVFMAQFPSPEVAQNSYDYRTLGLGYANLGALLMQMGMGYSSKEGRAFGAALTALMTGRAYRMSAQMAAAVGPFAKYKENENDMLRVIRNHCRAAGCVELGDYEGLNIVPVSLDSETLDERLGHTGLSEAVRLTWREALHFGEEFGYRNAQTTCIAPTGTIAFVMDCDTTGIEPEFALTKHKVLAGGGSMTIVNKSVEQALLSLGVERANVEEAVKTVLEGGDIRKLFEGRDDYERCVRVFQTAVGSNPLSWMDHVMMMAACQPFVSGAISKTVNMPAEASELDVSAAFRVAHAVGLKAVAIYRDGSKLSQPLNTKKKAAPAPVEDLEADVNDAKGGDAPKVETFPDVTPTDADDVQSKSGKDRITRRVPPKTRDSITHKFRIDGHTGYFTVGLFEDGTPCELFIRLAKAGSTVHGLYENLGRAISMALQYGVPFERVAATFSHQRFAPAGMTDDTTIKFASSVLDYIFRWLTAELPRYAPRPGRRGEGVPTVPPAPDERHRDTTTALPSTPGEVRPGLDTPPCPECGTMMVRTGACHTCPQCGYNGGCG